MIVVGGNVFHSFHAREYPSHMHPRRRVFQGLSIRYGVAGVAKFITLTFVWPVVWQSSLLAESPCEKKVFFV